MEESLMNSRLPTFLFVVGVPFTLIVVLFPFYNRIDPMIFGFPLLYAWMFACLGISSLSMYIGWRIDPRSDRNLRARQQGETGRSEEAPQTRRGDK
jgi:hypothetical protein